MPKFDDWFVVIMGILCPLTIVLGVCAFVPSLTTIKGWFTRGN